MNAKRKPVPLHTIAMMLVLLLGLTLVSTWSAFLVWCAYRLGAAAWAGLCGLLGS